MGIHLIEMANVQLNEVEMAQQDRAESIRRMNTIINWIGTAPFNLLNAHQLNERSDRFKNTLATIKQDTLVVAHSMADQVERTAFMDEFYEFEERCIDAIAAIALRREQLAPPPANQAAAAAPDGAGAQPALNPAAPVFNLQLPLQPSNINRT